MSFKSFSKKIGSKRYFIGIAIVVPIGYAILHSFYIIYPSNITSKLSLQLHADKTNYVQAEPVRLTALLVNNTEEQIKISYPIKHRPFSISFYVSKESNSWHNISTVPIPRSITICGSGIHFLPRRRTMLIQPKSSLAIQEWMMDNYTYTTDLGHGQTDFIAKLTFNSLFSRKTNTIESNKIKIKYIQPLSENKAAYDFMKSNKLIDAGQFKFNPNYMSMVLVYNAGSSSSKLVYRNFLEGYALTAYAPYIQYTQAMTHRHHNCEKYGEILSGLLETAPSDFPLLPEICIELLEYYYNHSELPKMRELAQSKLIKQLNILNPNTQKRLDYLLELIAWWPPDTPVEKHKAEKAFRTREAVKTAKNHWLTEILLKTYGDHYKNELQFSSREPDRTALYFYDKNIEGCIFITYHFNEDSSLKEVRVSGPLSSASVGPFNELSNRLQDEFKFQEQVLSSAKIDAILIGKTLEGRIFKDDKQETAIIPYFTFKINDASLEEI